MSDSASFGFETVPLADKQALVDDVFHSVARRYDLMNDLMSGGLHRALEGRDGQRAQSAEARPAVAARSTSPAAPATSPSASRSARAATPRSPSPTSTRRCSRSGASGRRSAASRASQFREANAESAALRGRELRRLYDRLRHPQRAAHRGGARRSLSRAEARRAFPLPGILRRSTRRCSTASTRLIPSASSRALGRAVAGDAESYRYLVESIRTFPNQERFADMIRAAGFARVSYRNFSGGIAALHSGWKL